MDYDEGAWRVFYPGCDHGFSNLTCDSNYKELGAWAENTVGRTFALHGEDLV